MRNIFSVLALASLLLTSASQVALAQDSTGDNSQPTFNARIEGEVAALPVVPEQNDEVIGIGAASPASEMGLSDEQLEKIHGLKSSFQDSSGKKMLELKTLHRQLKDLLLKDKVDRTKANEIQSKINAIKSDLSSARLSMRLDTYDVLTADQKQKLRHKALQREAFGGGKRGGCGGKRMMMHRKGGRPGQV